MEGASMDFAAFINVLFLPAPLLFVPRVDDTSWRAGEHKLRVQASRNLIDASFIASFFILFCVGPRGYHWDPSCCCSVPESRDIIPRCTWPPPSHLVSPCSSAAQITCHLFRSILRLVRCVRCARPKGLVVCSGCELITELSGERKEHQR